MQNQVYRSLRDEIGIRRLYSLRAAESKNEFVSLKLWNTKLDADNYGSSEAFRRNMVSARNLLESKASILKYDVKSHVINPRIFLLQHQSKYLPRLSREHIALREIGRSQANAQSENPLEENPEDKAQPETMIGWS